MGDFTIVISEGKKYCVKRFIVELLQVTDYFDINSKSSSPESSSEPISTFIGFKYVVTDSNDENNKKEFILYKLEIGEWFMDSRGQIPIEDDFILAIKNVIIQKESELNYK